MKYKEKTDRIKILPRYYFVVSGAALSSISPLNAFDRAIKVAGIHNTNLVEVSSILPKGVTHLELTSEEVEAFFEPGEIVFAVHACRMGRGGEHISAGLMWGDGLETNGYVVEHSSSIPSSEAEIQNDELIRETIDMLRSKFREGVGIRSIRTGKPRYKIADIFVPKDMYGCAHTSLILC